MATRLAGTKYAPRIPRGYVDLTEMKLWFEPVHRVPIQWPTSTLCSRSRGWRIWVAGLLACALALFSACSAHDVPRVLLYRLIRPSTGSDCYTFRRRRKNSSFCPCISRKPSE